MSPSVSSEFSEETNSASTAAFTPSEFALGHETVLINLGLKLHDMGSNEAYSTLHRAICANPESSFPLLGLGITLLSDGHLVEANYYLLKLLKVTSEVSPSARLLAYKSLATLRRLNRNYDAALTWLHRALELHPHDEEVLCNLAEVLVQCRKYKEALKAFEKISRSPKYAAEVAQGRADALSKLGRYDAALEVWADFLATGPELQTLQNRCAALLSCARVLVHLEHLAEAEAKYSEVLELSPDSYEAYLGLASLAQRRGDQNKALSLFEEVAKNDSNLVNSSIAWRAIGGLFQEQGHPAKAVASWLEAGGLLLSLCLFEAACETFTWILEVDQRNELALAGRAEVLRIMGDYRAAEQDCRHLLEASPLDPWAIASQAHIYLAQKKPQDAVREFDRALHLSSELDWVWAGRGEAHLRLRDFGKAIDDFTVALTKDPDYFAALLSRGSCYRISQNYQAAITDLRRAMELNSNHLDCRVGLANVYRWMECYQEATNELERVLDYHPEHPSALAAKVALLNFQGEHKKAVTLFEEHSNVLAERLTTCVFYGESLVFIRRDKDAHNVFQNVLQKDKGSSWNLSVDRSWTMYFDSLALLRLGSHDSAKEQLAKAIEIEEQSLEKCGRDRARINLALFLLVSGQEKKAKSQYRTVLQEIESRYILLEAQRDLQDYDHLIPGNSNVRLQIKYVAQRLEQVPTDEALNFTWRPYCSTLDPFVSAYNPSGK